MASPERPLAHMVYFRLRDRSRSAVDRLINACREYLTGHQGTLYFSVGTLNTDLRREVNDREFDVALHLIFANRSAHDEYQVSDRHQRFIETNKADWERVRVFDADIAD